MDSSIHIVCIHGAGGDSRLFVPLLNVLTAFTVHAIDLPGHGKTKINETTLDVYVHTVKEFCESIQGSVVVLGHSMGGGIIFELIKAGAHIDAAVFLATAGKLPVNPVVFELIEKDFDGLCTLAVDLSYGNITQQMRTTAIAYMKEAGSSILQNDFALCNEYNYDEFATQCTLPVCFIANRKDKMVPLDITYTTFKAMPNALLQVLPYKGHMLHIEQPKQVARCIEYFVELSL